ncbi:MAG: hypothetical protein QW035_03045 [Candidatus Anstonellales archaeon]
MLFLLALLITNPVAMQVDSGDIVDLGQIGPGQTLAIEINPIVSEGGKLGKGGRYDIAYAEQLPEGWKSEPSKLLSNPLQVLVKSAPDAQDGVYYFRVVAQDEGNAEGLGTFGFSGKVRITRDILAAYVDKQAMDVGVGQPARFYITIENKGSAGDTFVIRAEGLDSVLQRVVYVPPRTPKKVSYEITLKEQESLNIPVKVSSYSSPEISTSMVLSVSAKPDIIADYKACGNGLMLMPFVEQPVCSFAAFISNFL